MLKTIYFFTPLDIQNTRLILRLINVFEHIDPFPSIQIAFNNLFRMLKCGGFIIFSVPFTYDEHKEHYPNLYNYKIEMNKDGEYILHNITIDNKIEIFNNLCFHGGPGNTLEMRLFSKKSIISFLEKSGFVDIVFYEIDKDMNNYGIFYENKCSLMISAKKPAF